MKAMSFEQAWHKAKPGQMLKHGDFSIIKSEFITPDFMLVFYSGCPGDSGWKICRALT